MLLTKVIEFYRSELHVVICPFKHLILPLASFSTNLLMYLNLLSVPLFFFEKKHPSFFIVIIYECLGNTFLQREKDNSMDHKGHYGVIGMALLFYLHLYLGPSHVVVFLTNTFD